MKKTITIITCLFLAGGLFAQITPGQDHSGLIKAKNDKTTLSGDEALSHLMVHPNPHTSFVKNSKSSTMNEETIGWTTYDLQSNAAVQNRIVVNNDGTISAGWTMSTSMVNSFTDRGTGYNFFDGNNWTFSAPAPPNPNLRLESSRGGWPSILALGNGGECAITHNTDGSFINNTYRSYIGTGPWLEAAITTDYLIWNRSATGGTDGNTIHMIALTEPSGGTWTGVPFNGVSGALLYYRSQDGGDSWDIQNMQLPGTDSSSQIGMSGDCYAIAAEENTVVIAYFDDLGDSFIVKSTENGDSASWTKTTFLDFPIDKYAMDDGINLDNDTMLDRVYSTDNYGAVILDDNLNAHVFYGIMMYADDDLADEGFSWFPSINGIAYWNESFGPDTTPATIHVGDTSLWYSDMMNNHWIAAAPDLDANGTVGGVDSTMGYALYYASRASMPNAGIDADGNLWLSFSAYTETADNGTQVFRHLYVTKSEDGGITWENPVDVTPCTDWAGMQECVFGSMSPVVDDKIRIVYQLDFEPGLAVRGDEDLISDNAIVYLEIDTAGLFNNTTPTAIIETEDINQINDNKIFDILGREWKKDFADLPKGIYIIDGKKIFKTK